MLFFGMLIVFVASNLSQSNAAISRPDQVLEQLGGVQKTIFTYQSSVQDQIRGFRRVSGERTGEFFNRTLDIIDGSIKNISASDLAIRATLGAATQSACITNLVNFIDQIIELSGYAISNCIEIKDDCTLNATGEITVLLDALEREVNFLQEVAVTSLVSRNVFTQGDEIIVRIKEDFEIKTAEIAKKIAEIAEIARGFATSSKRGFEILTVCFEDINSSIQSGILAVQAQLPICARFGSRGGRSVLPSPMNFFPQL